jgi:hypothetical protein
MNDNCHVLQNMFIMEPNFLALCISLESLMNYGKDAA